MGADDGRTRVGQVRSSRLEDVDLDPFERQVGEQVDEAFLAGALAVPGGIEQVDTEDAERLLLQRVGGVPHVDVQEDVVRRAARPDLEPQSHPSVALVGAIEVAGRDGVGEREEARLGAARGVEALQEERVLVVQHRDQALARHVAAGLAVDGVADRHVVGGDRLGDGARGAARLQEPAGDLLPGADLGEGPVGRPIQIDCEGSPVRVHGCLWR